MPSLASLTKSCVIGLLVAINVSTDVPTVSAKGTTKQRLVTDKTEPYVLNVPAGARRSDTIKAASAKYVSVHFAHFQLPPGDKVIVRSVDGQASFEFEGLGRGDHGLDGGFYSPMIAGDSVVVDYVVSQSSASNDTANSGSVNGVLEGVVGLNGNADGALGYRIDHISRSINSASPSSICGSEDQSKNAQCFENDIELPSAYTKSRAVARLYSQNYGVCTGWLLGSEGHLMTNAHCIGSQSDADSTEYEFMVEIPCKSKPPRGKLSTRGVRVATTATLVAMSAPELLDYALVKLNTTVELSQFGYLTLRVAGPKVNESVYLPQYPRGEPKRLANVRQDGGRTQIVGSERTELCLTRATVELPYRLMHDADTESGSSGAPLVSTRDNAVIGMHNCGACARENDELVALNTAIDSRALVRDLLVKNALPRDAVDDAPEKAQDGPWMPGYEARLEQPQSPSLTSTSTTASSSLTPEPTSAPSDVGSVAPTPPAAPATTTLTPVSTTPATTREKVKHFFDNVWSTIIGIFGKK